jgi:polyphosphate kinase
MTNLDEFYMIRVAGLKELFHLGVSDSGSDKMTPLEQLSAIREYLKQEKDELETLYSSVIKELEEEGLFICNYTELSVENRRVADEYFFTNIFPTVIPIAVDATHPFPHLNNLSFALAIKLQDKDDGSVIKYGMVRIPRILPRFIKVSESIYIPIESLVKEHIETLFPGYTIISYATFRVTRNADIEIEEEEADDFLEIIEQGLRMRRRGRIVRLSIKKDADEDLVNFLNSHLKVFPEDIYEYSVPLNLGALWEIVSNKSFSHLALPPVSAKNLPPFDSNENIFTTIEREDVMVYHPYEKFDPITKLIRTAAKDPDVLSIKMTLYRVEKNSPIINALIEAANNGIQVTAMFELKARFDEENNLHWAKALESAGAHVIYGIPGLKVHAKATQIIKKAEEGGLKFYLHFGTGNYNGSTSKVYTDISFFTSRREYAEDSTLFFHNLTGFGKYTKLSKLQMAPIQIKPKLLTMIANEMNYKAKGRIIAKVNSLVDEDVIKALYKASMVGVKVDLIVRGICCLKPGVKGVSDNINVRSLVGKYLEHARILYFEHDHYQTYISSADWMPRNLERRIELLTPIDEPKHAQKLIDILNLQLRDNQNAWALKEDGDYRKIEPAAGEDKRDAQAEYEKYISQLYKTLAKQRNVKKAKNLANRLMKES